jgi:hypothetical protein
MKTQPRATHSSGFALVVTLALMILLTVIGVGLLSLSTISLRSATQAEALAIARSNARLALMLAIGDLQKALGPDRAVSGPSGVLMARPAKPNMIGVWDSWWDFNPNSGSLSYGPEKLKRFRRWLVSTADPAAVESRDFATASWSGKTIELVGDNSLGGKADSGAKVVAGLVPVARNGKAQGAFAWHVADESLKARINLYRDPSQNATPSQQRALLAGQRPDPSVMKSADAAMLDCLPTDLDASAFTEAGKTTGKIIDLNQVDLLARAKGRIKPFRNDLTPYSLGLLTDVRGGGLKQDLSSVFEMSTRLPSELSNKKLYQSTHGITGVSDPYWSALADYYNIFRKITNRETDPALTVVPPQDDVTLTTKTMPTTFNPGPVIAKVEILLSFVVRESHGMWMGLLSGQSPDLKYMGHLILTPIVTLHNPYNVSISFDQLDLAFQNLPVAFRFYVNGQAQNTQLVSLNCLYWDDNRSQDRKFIIGIADWQDYSVGSTARKGALKMKPGQTLVCQIYMDPHTIFSQGDDSTWITNDRDLVGKFVKASPGFKGRCFGYDLDVLSPDAYSPPQAQQNDRVYKVLGLKSTDTIHMEYGLQKPPFDPSGEFKVSATLTSNGATKQYGGLSFKYKDDATLKTVFPKIYRYPSSGEFEAAEAHVSNTVSPDAWFSNHAGAKSVALFSAYARTTNGGVYETGKRAETAGAVNTLLDGRLAGKPFLFYNPARTVVTMDLATNKLGAGSHELNLGWLPGAVDDVFEISGERVNALTANTNRNGIKSGSYFEVPTGPLQTIADFRKSNALTSYYQPYFVQPVGNSSVHPLMSTDKVIEQDQSVSEDDMLDHSVLANHALYDRFYFSTFATRGSDTPDTVFEQFMNGGTPLPSQAFQAHLPDGMTLAAAKADLFATGKPKNDAYKSASQYQMIRGPFNVNSTSVQAWKAVLASMNKSEIITLWAKTAAFETQRATGVPIMGMSLINGGRLGATPDFTKIDDAKTNEWNGYRELTNDELESLATKVVDEVRTRGPFLSMSEFVNRQVGAESDLTLRGALEAAIDKSKINERFFTNQVAITAGDIMNPLLYNEQTPAASCGNPAAGAPGWISQGDLLRILEPAATVRGDTFVIRVCGEACDPSGKVTARAYAEAVVQRVPEYVDPADRPSLNVYSEPSAARMNKLFGRRILLLSFRWLSSNEV